MNMPPSGSYPQNPPYPQQPPGAAPQQHNQPQPPAPAPGGYPPQQQPGAAPQHYQPQQYQPPAPGGYPPQQQPAYPQPTEGIALDAQYFPLAFMMALFKPKVFVDGQETVQGGWGRQVVPAQPGRHQVHVHVPYFLPPRIGPADTVVDVYPGRFTELEYKAPVWGFSAGSLGAGPQQYNGVGITIAVMVAPLVLFFLMMIIMMATI